MNKNENLRRRELKNNVRYVSEESEWLRLNHQNTWRYYVQRSIDRVPNDTDETQRTTYKKKQRCNDGFLNVPQTGCSRTMNEQYVEYYTVL